MLKKAIACLLVLAGVCSFHTSAADSKNEQFVNVNVFNKVYYGTVTKNADAGEAIFTPAGKSADFLQIEGRWDDGVISYKDGESAEVQYKDGLISGKIKETDPDGIFLKYSANATVSEDFAETSLFLSDTND